MHFRAFAFACVLAASGNAAADESTKWATEVTVPPHGSKLELPKDPELSIEYPCGQEDPCGLNDFVKHAEPCALYVMHRGKVAYYGVWPDFGRHSEDGCPPKVRDNQYGVASITKSFTSVLFGIHLQNPDNNPLPLDAKVADALKAAKIVTYPDRDVTILDLLHMTSGMRWDDDRDAPPVLRVLKKGGTKVGGYRTQREIVEKYPPRMPPFDASRPYTYSGFDAQVLGVLLEHRLAQEKIPSLAAALETDIWTPLSMQQSALWKGDFKEHQAAHCCFSVSAEDLLRFGDWVRRKLRSNDFLGKWLKQSITETVPTGLDCRYEDYSRPFGYGYLWWVPNKSGEDDDGFTALGHGGQYLHIFPKQKVVIAQFGWRDPSWKDICEAMLVHRHIADSFSAQH